MSSITTFSAETYILPTCYPSCHYNKSQNTFLRSIDKHKISRPLKHGKMHKNDKKSNRLKINISRAKKI